LIYSKLRRGEYTAKIWVEYNKKKTSYYDLDFFVGRKIGLTGYVVNNVGKENLLFFGLVLVVIVFSLFKKKIKEIYQKSYKHSSKFKLKYARSEQNSQKMAKEMGNRKNI
jgi:hypothetical protein